MMCQHHPIAKATAVGALLLATAGPAITGYAIGDVRARPVLDHRARQIAAVSAFAALGNRTFMKIHAGYALNLGVSEDDLKEVIYLTTVHAGFPRAIQAAQMLSELFEERRKATGGQP